MIIADPLAPEALAPWLTTRRFGRNYHHFGEVASTMDVIRELAKVGAPDGTAVVAEVQTAGRGRRGRGWQAGPGRSILCSALLWPPPKAPMGPLSFLAPVAVVDALVAYPGLRAAIKWPNDVLAGGKKLAGMLAESGHLGPTAARAVLLGIGINVHQSAAELPEGATSVDMASGHAADRRILLARLLAALEQRWDEFLAHGPGPLLDAWRARQLVLGRRIAVLGPPDVEGLAEDITAEGQLVVRLEDGSRVVVSAGDVSIRPFGGGW